MRNIPFTREVPFTIETPYQVVETGEPGKKPLLVYLHGFNQNIKLFQQRTQALVHLEAYHLFVQAPYPVYSRRNRQKKVEDWGRSWYWYDGRQEQFQEALERASCLLDEVIDHALKQVSADRLTLLGYSMGGYLAGYFALSRYKRVNELVVIGGRIKTEIFEEKEKNYDYLHVLALHGKEDERVKSEFQKLACQKLEQWNARVTFKELDAVHKLDDLYIDETKRWLVSQNYKEE